MSIKSDSDALEATLMNKLATFFLCLVISLGINACISAYVLRDPALSHVGVGWFVIPTSVVVGTSVAFFFLRRSLPPIFEVKGKTWSSMLITYLICLIVSYGLTAWIVVGVRVYHLGTPLYWSPIVGACVTTGFPFLLDLSLPKK
jgi:hypothetical protein